MEESWNTLKRKIETKHTNAVKVMEKYKEIIELAEGQTNNLGLNRKSLKEEFKHLEAFKEEFNRIFDDDV